MPNKLNDSVTAGGEELEMDMSPMIDMVFLLLIFFMVTSTIIVNRLDPEVIIPVGKEAQPPEAVSGRVVVNVYADGTYKGEDVEGPLLDEAGITDMVADRKRMNTLESIKTRVLIRADEGVELEAVKKAVAAAADAGVIDVIFSAYQTAPGR